MTLRRSSLAAVAVAVLGLPPLGLTASARAAAPTAYPPIAPSLTDPAIVDTASPVPGTRGDHLVWLAPPERRGGEMRVWLAPPERRVGKLLVFLPTGGPTNIPSEFTELGSVAGRLGYHTVLLAYRNEAPVAANPPAGCGPLADKDPLNPTCSIDVRSEILNGTPTSPLVNINRANSIENRLNKLLVYLD